MATSETTPKPQTEALVPVIQQPKPSLLKEMAAKYGVEASKMKETLIKTVFSKCKDVTDEQFIAFMIVANQYNLNPFTNEIYAFPKDGGIVPIVPIDGWVSIVQRHAQYDGVEQIENFDDNGIDIISITTKIYRKDHSRPTIKTEYYEECVKDTGPWKKWPIRMLGHKSYIQCARYAFGLSGIYDPDEGDRIIEGTATIAALPPEESTQYDQAFELLTKLEPDWNAAKCRAEIKGQKNLSAYVDTLKTRMHEYLNKIAKAAEAKAAPAETKTEPAVESKPEASKTEAPAKQANTLNLDF